jgi:hypothetical protein
MGRQALRGPGERKYERRAARAKHEGAAAERCGALDFGWGEREASAGERERSARAQQRSVAEPLILDGVSEKRAPGSASEARGRSSEALRSP